MNYSKDSKIDHNALDIEWLEHAELVTKYIEKVSVLRREKDLLHEELKTVRSELIRDANDDPQKCCNKAKPNAADIEAYYRTHPDYKAKKKELIDAEDAYQVMLDIKDNFNFNRTKALENLVILHGQQYFAGPSMPRNIDSEMLQREKAKKSAIKKIGSNLRRKNAS